MLLVTVLCIVLGLALCTVMLSFVPWVQTNMRWMTSLKFYVFVGLLVGGALVWILMYMDSLLAGIEID